MQRYSDDRGRETILVRDFQEFCKETAANGWKTVGFIVGGTLTTIGGFTVREAAGWVIAALGFVCVAWGMFQAWRDQRHLVRNRDGQIADLTERLRPRFSVACGKDVPGSFTGKPNMCTHTILPNRLGGPLNMFCHYHRIAVTAECFGALKGCFGEMERIDFGDAEIWANEEAKLTFAPANEPDRFSKTISNQATAFLDVIAASKDGRAFICTQNLEWRYDLRVGAPFLQKGRYTLAVLLRAEETAPQRAILDFDWTGDWQTCELKLLRLERPDQAARR